MDDELTQVQNLIAQLYDHKSSPETIQVAQQNLLVAQKSAQGWQLASWLLNLDDSNSQFIGALTFSIKLNDEKFEVPDSVQSQLLQHLQDSISRGYKLFVMRKLFNTIITLYMKTYSKWNTFAIDIHSCLSSHLELELQLFGELAEMYQQGYSGVPTLKENLAAMVPSVIHLLELGFRQYPVAALSTFNSWCAIFSSEFQHLLGAAVELINSDSEDIFERSCQALSELYTNHSRAWQKGEKNAIIATVLHRTQASGTNEHLGRLALAICSQDILLKDVNASHLLPYILALTDGPPVDEDELLNEVLEFWNTFGEDVVAEGMTSDYNGLFMQVVQIYWRRIQSGSDWEIIHSFRADFCDYLELVYPLLGRTLFETFAKNILECLQSSPYNWSNIEASLCCLNGLADYCEADSHESKAIEAVFSSPLWGELGSCPTVRVRHTAINVIGSYDSFFVQPNGQKNLAPVLTYLFESLAQKKLQLTASRSIQKLCSACRQHLHNQIYQFLQVYEPLRFKLDPVAHQRTVSAIAFIVQALPIEEQAEPLWRLLLLAETSEMEPVDTVKCISSIGKALKEPTDNTPEEKRAKAEAYWNNQSQIRENLVQVINQAFNMPYEVFEELCQIFKAGLSENVPTAFSLGPVAALDFLEAKHAQANSEFSPAILDLAIFVICTQHANKALNLQVVQRAVNLITLDAVAPSLDLLEHILARIPEMFLQLPNVTDYIQLALGGLSSNDRFVLSKASRFWITFLSEPSCKDATQTYGLELVNKIALQVSGEAERSEVQYFSDIIRKLVAKHMRLSGQLLKKAFIDDPQPRSLRKQDEKTRSTFVSQLQLLRGSSQTRQVVNKFWLFCRGLPEY